MRPLLLNPPSAQAGSVDTFPGPAEEIAQHLGPECCQPLCLSLCLTTTGAHKEVNVSPCPQGSSYPRPQEGYACGK